MGRTAPHASQCRPGCRQAMLSAGIATAGPGEAAERQRTGPAAACGGFRGVAPRDSTAGPGEAAERQRTGPAAACGGFRGVAPRDSTAGPEEAAERQRTGPAARPAHQVRTLAAAVPAAA